jgi:sec-independent protein translocase protein TatB
MGFGNIGIGELMMILLVVMLVFGPKRLPGIARDMGKFLRDFRRETNAAIKELKEGIDIEEIKVGIFDEPDAKPGVKAPNGAVSMPAEVPGAVAAAGVSVAAPAEQAAKPNGQAPKPNGSRSSKPRKATAGRKAAASSTRRKTSTATSKKQARSTSGKSKTKAASARPARKR